MLTKAQAQNEILIRQADYVLTMDDARRELRGADVLLRDGVIAAVGQGIIAPHAEVVWAKGCVVTPGLVNTHHHLYQSLTRAVPGGAGCVAFWLAEDALPDLGAFWPRRNASINADGIGGIGSFGLHADIGSPLPVP